jgi:DNA-binding protein HU-beta
LIIHDSWPHDVYGARRFASTGSEAIDVGEEDGRVNKTELIETVAKATGEPKRVVGDVVDGVVGTIQKQVKKGDKVTLPGFGTFSRRQRAARQARNPQTGEAIKVKASKVPAFKAGTGFKNYVSGTRKKS